MSRSLLLDTSAVIPHLRREEAVTRLFDSADYLYLPIIALGELFHGAWRLPFPKNQLEKIHTLQKAVIVLGLGTETADHFGQITAHLRVEGRTIPTNDAWIAALAREYRLPLVAEDEHFSWVPDPGPRALVIRQPAFPTDVQTFATEIYLRPDERAYLSKRCCTRQRNEAVRGLSKCGNMESGE